MKRILACALLCGVTMSPAQAALVDRGGGMIYDTELDITWLHDANYAQTSGYDSDGRMRWSDANNWASNLVYGGFDDWRLPTVGPVGASFNYSFFSNNGTTDRGYGNTSANSELAYMYYVNLGNLGYCTPNNSAPEECDEQSGYGLANSGPFTHLQSDAYWSSTAYAPDSSKAWSFATEGGSQFGTDKGGERYAWAVRDGDVAPPVPLPAAAWLLLSGLGGLGVMARRQRVRS